MMMIMINKNHAALNQLHYYAIGNSLLLLTGYKHRFQSCFYSVTNTCLLKCLQTPFMYFVYCYFVTWYVLYGLMTTRLNELLLLVCLALYSIH